jgi:hypothetical protein
MPKLVPLKKSGEMLNIAVTPHDFRTAKVVPDGKGGFQTYEDAGYKLTDHYEDGSEFVAPEQRQSAPASEAKADGKKGD